MLCSSSSRKGHTKPDLNSSYLYLVASGKGCPAAGNLLWFLVSFKAPNLTEFVPLFGRFRRKPTPDFAARSKSHVCQAVLTAQRPGAVPGAGSRPQERAPGAPAEPHASAAARRGLQARERGPSGAQHAQTHPVQSAQPRGAPAARPRAHAAAFPRKPRRCVWRRLHPPDPLGLLQSAALAPDPEPGLRGQAPSAAAADGQPALPPPGSGPAAAPAEQQAPGAVHAAAVRPGAGAPAAAALQARPGPPASGVRRRRRDPEAPAAEPVPQLVRTSPAFAWTLGASASSAQ